MTAVRSVSRPRVLIADDEPLVRTVLQAQLGDRYDVVGLAADAEEAASLACEHQPDAAIIDVEMPGGGGLIATRRIRDCSPGTAILVLSSDESRDGVLSLLRAGAVSYLRKGLRASELSSALGESIEAHAKLTTDAC